MLLSAAIGTQQAGSAGAGDFYCPSVLTQYISLERGTVRVPSSKHPPLTTDSEAGPRPQRTRHKAKTELTHPLINRKIQDAVDLARRGLTREAHTAFSDAAALAEQANEPEAAALVYLTEIEQLARILSQEHLRLSYLKAARLLKSSTNDTLHERLLRCADLILLNSDLRPEAIIFLAADDSTNQVVREARELASLPTPVLIVGPTGAGKETLARAIHEWSGRPGELTVLNCDTVQRDELLFCLDTASTLVLKNVSRLPPALSPELLSRFITRGPARVRLIATSTVPLDLDPPSAPEIPRELVTYIRTIQLTLEPLAVRPKDTLVLASRFLEEANLRYKKGVQIQSAALPYFRALIYPENVSTLQQLIERTVASSDRNAVITTKQMRTAAARESLPQSLADPWANFSLEQELILHERRMIREALEGADGSITKASRLLGMRHHQTLNNKIDSKHPELQSVRHTPGTRTRKLKAKLTE